MDITEAIERLSDNIVAYRFVQSVEKGLAMPLEIKGLKANMQKVALRIARLNAKAVAFDEVGAAVEQGLDDITAQVKSHGDDMSFAATVLGNSTSASEGSPEVERPGPTAFPVEGAAESDKIA